MQMIFELFVKFWMVCTVGGTVIILGCAVVDSVSHSRKSGSQIRENEKGA
jgi:hypothetical protein